MQHLQVRLKISEISHHCNFQYSNLSTKYKNCKFFQSFDQHTFETKPINFQKVRRLPSYQFLCTLEYNPNLYYKIVYSEATAETKVSVPSRCDSSCLLIAIRVSPKWLSCKIWVSLRFGLRKAIVDIRMKIPETTFVRKMLDMGTFLKRSVRKQLTEPSSCTRHIVSPKRLATDNTVSWGK